MDRKFTILSGFWLKIIAFILMTIDHVGWALSEFIGENFVLVEPFRYIGRLALPLFCFLIAEGVMNTKHFGKYALRLGIMATLISGALIAVEYLPIFEGYSLWAEGNIFIDLLLGALTIYFLKRKEIWLKALAVIPLAFSIVSFAVTSYECAGNVVYWFPFFLRMQYGWYSLLMIAGFYFAYILKGWALEYHESKTGMKKEYLEGSFLDRNLTNVFAMGMLIVVTMALYICSFFMNFDYIFWNPGVQNMAMFSGAFILLYNGKRGYNAKWFEYGSYFFYPVHLIIIFGIALLCA